VPARTSTKPADVSADVEAFSSALDDFMRAVRRAQGRVAAAQADGTVEPVGGLTLSQYRLVEPLLNAPAGVGVTELALQAGVSAPTATRTFDGLARDGVVVRERGTGGDGRAVCIRLTVDGAQMTRTKRRHIEGRRAEIHASLPADVRKQAAGVLAHLADAIEHLR
jgi:DNA-binding MarR family transcriptional regulator